MELLAHPAAAAYLARLAHLVGQIVESVGVAVGTPSALADDGPPSGRGPDAADGGTTSPVSTHLFTAALLLTIVVFIARPMWHLRRMRRLQAEASAAASRPRS